MGLRRASLCPSHTFLLLWVFCFSLGLLWLSGFLEGLVCFFFFPVLWFTRQAEVSLQKTVCRYPVPFGFLVYSNLLAFFLIGRVTEMTKILSHQLRMLWSQLCGWQQCHPVSLQAGGPTENSFIKPFPAIPVSSSSPTSTSRLLSWCFLAIIYFLSLLFNFLPGDEFMAAWQSAAVRAAQITIWIRHLSWNSLGL